MLVHVYPYLSPEPYILTSIHVYYVSFHAFYWCTSNLHLYCIDDENKSFQNISMGNHYNCMVTEDCGFRNRWQLIRSTSYQNFVPNRRTYQCISNALTSFTANHVSNGKKVSVFLTVIGGRTYTLLCSLLLPQCPQDKRYEELVETLK